MANNNGFLVNRRKFLRVSVSAGIGLAIPSLIHLCEDNKAEARANAALGVLAALLTSIPVMSTLTGVAESYLKQKLEEVKNHYGITASNNNISTIAKGKKLLKTSNYVLASSNYQQWNEQEAGYYINGLFGEKVNQSQTPTVQLWAMNTEYKVGEIVVFQEKKYKCIQGHTTYALNWYPSIHTRALWEPLS